MRSRPPDGMTPESHQHQHWDWFGAEALPLPQQLDQESLRTVLRVVDDRLQRQALVVEAMRELLEEAGLFRQDQLIARVEAIDLRDGVADGRRSGVAHQQRCGDCGRSLNIRRMRCLYCGSTTLHPIA